MHKANSRLILIRSAQIALVAASIFAPASASAQWGPYSGPYGYGGYGYGGYGYGAYGAYGFYPPTRYTVPSDQIHWYTRNPPDFNS